MPQTKPAYTEEFRREVLAYLASTSNSMDAPTKHFGISANSL